MLQKHRRIILLELNKGPRTPSSLAQILLLHTRQVSWHLRILRDADLIRRETNPKEVAVPYRLTDKGIATIKEYGF